MRSSPKIQQTSPKLRNVRSKIIDNNTTSKVELYVIYEHLSLHMHLRTKLETLAYILSKFGHVVNII